VLPVNNENILAFEKRSGQDHLLIVLNFAETVTSFINPAARSLRKIFDSSASEWNGPGDVCPHEVASGAPLKMNSESAVIFELK
jgi:hypothetical protein